jgi:1-acyl-sn-glycerol-3-phosphate acyltransferase
VWYSFLRYWIRIVFAVAFKIRVLGRENVPLSGGVILAANHQSYMDPLLIGIGLNRQVHYMARKSLFGRFFLFTWLIRSVNAFPVERDRGDIGAIRETLRRLKSGAGVVIFPEATRTSDGAVRDLKPGLFMVASRAGVPVVPAVVDGAFEAWPRHEILPRPFPIVVAFGEPLSADDFPSAGEMAAACRCRLLRLQCDIRAFRRGLCAPALVGKGDPPCPSR